MKCEVSEEEYRFLERYRDLTPEFQKVLEENAEVLFVTQRETIKRLLGRE